MNARPGSRQRGIAALTAMLVVAIATVLAVNLLWRTSVDLQRTETLLLQDQARQYDLGGEELARFLLAEDERQDGIGGTDSRLDPLFSTPVLFEVEGGTLKGFVTDEQGRFDLNSLIDNNGQRVEAATRQFERLLQLLDLERPLDSGTATALVEATVDWLDPDGSPLMSGAEDDEYTSREPPYRPANFWFVSASELLAIKGFTSEIYDQLRPLVTALPRNPEESSGGRWPLNVNTAPPLVLASLADNVGPDDVRTDVEYEDLADFRSDYPNGGGNIDQKLTLGLGSSWFLLTVTTTLGTAQSTMYSLMERDGEQVRTRLRTFDAIDSPGP